MPKGIGYRGIQQEQALKLGKNGVSPRKAMAMGMSYSSAKKQAMPKHNAKYNEASFTGGSNLKGKKA